MFPWSDHCLYERARRRRRLGSEREVIAKWSEDVCSGEELPEVEIISLVEEQIPKYKLRADTLTSFTGYENQDWFIPDPALRPEEIDSPLTPEQIRETFNYFLLCSTRVSQMSKTYNDIEAVTRLLEEKEKDIELTARIGKELLAHNAKLESNVTSLETELRQSNDKITQLSHELLKKTELIQILTNDVDDSGSESSTPTGGLKSVQFDMLQRRITDLESENISLRSEAQRLAADTEDCELHEARLVNDLVSQIERMRSELGQSGVEAEAWRTRDGDLSFQITQLQARLKETELQLSQALKENEEYIVKINIGRETQSELASELADVKERYSELMAIVKELRENAVRTNKKSQPKVRVGGAYPSLHTSVPTQNPDSLAAELECSLFSELSLDSGIGASTGPIPNYKKVFETVRCASRAGSSSSEVSNAGSPAPRLGGATLTPSRPRPTATVCPQPILSQSSEEFQYNNFMGKPSPSDDLETALKGLTPAAIDARRAAMSSSSFLGEECPTPDSILSTGSSGYAPWKLPDKLQIVKPVEGSLTLHQWSELATPSLGGLLEERPGVKVRGGTELEALGIKMYSLSDVEEDDDVNPGKSFQDTSHIYTYTNSTVMHPDDNTIMTTSIRGTQMSVSTVGSRVSSMAPTPLSRSRRNSTSTKSTTPGLAALLQERGIKAATPSTFISPTATPCNSPDRSPSPVSDDESSSYSPLGIPGFLMTSGVEMLKRALGKTPPISALARPDKKAGLTGIRLVEKLERMGLEEILTSPNQGTALHQAGLRRATRALHSGSGVLGVPGRPGRGELEARLASSGRGGPRGLRPDLGSVPSQHSPGGGGGGTNQNHQSSLTNLLFARKGGLL